MKSLNLPKKYLSYSAWKLWKDDKNKFRLKYYENQELLQTPEIVFGHHIARLLEDPTFMPHIMRYPKCEFRIETEIKGVPVLSYLDSYNEELFKFTENKTGHLRKDGKVPWNNVLVAKHDQLPFYSAVIETKFGEVDNVCTLIWLETAFKKKQIEFAGHTLESDSRELELTGRVEMFERRIYKWEREAIRKDILKVAEEISEDFTSYEKARNK